MKNSPSKPQKMDTKVMKKRQVNLTKEPIELYKILKFEGIFSSGGAAKAAVAEGLVTVNGEIETRKRKKIVSGDVIELKDEIIQIQLS